MGLRVNEVNLGGYMVDFEIIMGVWLRFQEAERTEEIYSGDDKELQCQDSRIRISDWSGKLSIPINDAVGTVRTSRREIISKYLRFGCLRMLWMKFME